MAYGDHRPGMGGEGVNDPGLGKGLGPGLGQGPDNNKTGLGQKETPTKLGFGQGILNSIKNFNVGNFLDKAYTGTGQFLGSTNVPIQAGLFGLNVANFRPQFDGDVTTGSSRFGKLGTSLHGSYNLNNPAYGFTDEQKQEFANALYSPDYDNADVLGNPGYTVDADAARQYAESISPGVFDSLSLEDKAREAAARTDSKLEKQPVTETFINPIESKFTEEQLTAYNEYIIRGYPPEMAEYLVTTLS